MYLSTEFRTMTNYNVAPIVVVTTPVPRGTESLRPAGSTGFDVQPPANDRGQSLHVDVPEPESESEDSSEDDTDSDFVTASESESEESDDEEQSEETRLHEREAREAERQRVLEAAGLIIKQEAKPPPRPARRASRRRPPVPAVPERSPRLTSPHKDLPPLPEPDDDAGNQSLRLDDAYERYEAFRQSHLAANRLSIASVESGTASSPTAPSFASTAGTGEALPPVSASTSSGSGFLHFFGRRTPANDSGDATPTRPVISAPILQREPSPGPDSEAAFGTVSGSLCTHV